LFVIVGGLVVAVLMAALLAPLFIDWTSYRADFEREASKILGRPVKVAGDANARILPFPSLSFTNVRVGEDIENPALTIERFSMDAELSPLISGEVLIFDMRVTRPRGVIVIDENGQIDWTLRPNSPFDPSNVRIENLVIEGGQFDLVDQAAGRTHFIKLPSAIVSAKALTGPWRLKGMADVNGEQMHLSVSTGQTAEGVLPLRVSALPIVRQIVIESDGSAKADAGKVSYAGQFILRPALKSDYAAAQIQAASALSVGDGQFKVTGKFGLAPTGLALPEFKLETGAKENPYVASGSGSLIFGPTPMFDLKLDGTQVNFSSEEDVGAGAGLAGRIDTFRQFVNALPIPAMPGSIDVNLPAIVAGDTTVRDVAFSAMPENGAWRVRNFKSTLPGRTLFEADGLLGRGEAFGFKGKLLVASNQPAGLANWLTGQVDPAIRKLSAIGFSSNVDLKPDEQTFDTLELALGGATFTGSAQRRNDGTRPVLSLTLSGGALDLDSLNALGQGFIGVKGESRFDGHDVSLTLDAGPVSQSGVEAARLGVSLRMKANVIDVDRFMLTDVAGASLSATGKITDFGDAFSGSVDASLVSANGSQFTAMLAQRFPNNPSLQTLAARIDLVPDLLNDLNASIIANTAQEAQVRGITISLNAKTPTGELTFAGNGKGPDLASVVGSFRGSLRQDDPLNLVALAGIPLVPLGAPGPAILEFSGAGDVNAGLETTVKFDAAHTDAGFYGTIAFGQTGFAADGRILLTSDDFDPYLTATGWAFSGVGTGTRLTIRSDVKADVNGVNFSQVDGLIRDNNIAGALALQFSDRPIISGDLAIDRLDLAWLGENLFGTGLLDSADGRVGATAFSTNPVVPFDGRVAFSARTFDFGPTAQATNAKGKLDLTASTIKVADFAATHLGGALTATLEMTNDAGVGAVNGNFSLQNAQSAYIETLNPISGAIDLSGSLTASGKTLNGLTAGLTGSGIAAIRDGMVPGFSPDGFAPIAASAATSERAPALHEVEKMIAASVRTGRFPLQADALPWTIAGGKLRMTGIKGLAKGAVLNADISADLSLGDASVAGTIVYDAGSDSVVGAEPVVPFLASVNQSQPSLITDAQPMLQFLTQSALEREQARVEALRSALVEKQRLRRDVRLIGLIYRERDQRAQLREEAIRGEALRKSAILVAQWEAEKARLEEERIALEEAQKAQAALEAAAAKQAVEEAAKAKAERELKAFEPTLPNFGPLNDTFKSLQFE
jgi:AsmA family